jgi:hypothetical protein
MALRRSALVVFGSSTSKPIIVCMQEDALPANPGDDWLVLARDSDIFPTEPAPPRRFTSNGPASGNSSLPASR